MAFLTGVCAAAMGASAQDWRSDESRLLADPVQLTFSRDFIKAGEAYFSPDSRWIVFQAIERPKDGIEPDPFYAMYVARLTPGQAPGDPAFALDKPIRISGAGTANTCGWFDPARPGRVLFGSTLTRPQEDPHSGFQVGARKYVWMFPDEMEVVQRGVPEVMQDLRQFMKAPFDTTAPAQPAPLFRLPNYDAECSYDLTGRFVLYAHIEDVPKDPAPDAAPPRHDANIYIYDTRTQKHHAIVVAPGYDGGPFFSPDGKSICYRSDRKGDDLLQIFVADLKFEKDDQGVDVPTGLSREWQITRNEHVNWCPYWHPDGKSLLYATSEVGHTNYEVFAAQVDMAALRASDPEADASTLCKRERVTFAPGADVLPAFSADGRHVMWTSQRQGKAQGEERASSQLWIAGWKGFESASPGRVGP